MSAGRSIREVHGVGERCGQIRYVVRCRFLFALVTPTQEKSRSIRSNRATSAQRQQWLALSTRRFESYPTSRCYARLWIADSLTLIGSLTVFDLTPAYRAFPAPL